MRPVVIGLVAVACVFGLIFACSTVPREATPTTDAVSTSVGKDNSSTSEWLARLNAYREATGLSPVANNTALTAADLKHARYLVKNYTEGRSVGAWAHEEDTSNPWYSREGEDAGHTSDVIAPSRGQIDPDDALDSWLTAPFHALAILDLELKEAGYGEYCENEVCAAVLNVGRGESWVRNAVRLNLHQDPERQLQEDPAIRWVSVPQRVLPSPVEFPPNGKTVTKNTFPGHEWPDPLAACPGYVAPAGLPIVASFGTGFSPVISDYSLTCNGKQREACLITADSYFSTDERQQKAASGDLRMYAAIFLIPREPLPNDSNCTVSVTRDRTPHSWSFKVEPRSLILGN